MGRTAHRRYGSSAVQCAESSQMRAARLACRALSRRDDADASLVAAAVGCSPQRRQWVEAMRQSPWWNVTPSAAARAPRGRACVPRRSVRQNLNRLPSRTRAPRNASRS
eukprot:7245628-Prymnesium_polylepis.2